MNKNGNFNQRDIMLLVKQSLELYNVVHTCNGTVWGDCDLCGAGGSAVWGGITGTIGDQTDLAALLSGKEDVSNKGAANGYASLDGSGKVPSAQLPSYVDDVLEYANTAAFPGTGTSGIIYVAQDTNKTYRWSGSSYVEISPTTPGGSNTQVQFNNSGVLAGSANFVWVNGSSRLELTGSNRIIYSGDNTKYTTLGTNSAGLLSISAVSPFVELYDGTQAYTLRAYNANTENVRLASNGVSFLNGGNFGLGTSSPASKLDIVGTSLTGSAAGSALNITQTWNTTGTPTAIKLNVTDSASNSSSLLLDLQTGGSSKFSVNKSGSGTFSSYLYSGVALGISSKSLIKSDVDGNLTLLNAAENAFSLLKFGGTSSSFPAIKRSATDLQIRLADDSAYANIAANQMSFPASSAGPSTFSGIGNAGSSNYLFLHGLTRLYFGSAGNITAGVRDGGMFIGTDVAPSAKLEIQTNSLGTTQTTSSGIALTNVTAAAAGAQQISPAIRFTGQGWKTATTAASQQVDWQIDNLPVQGSSNPSTKLRFRSSVNGAAYTDQWSIDSNGVLLSENLNAILKVQQIQSASSQMTIYGSPVANGGTEIIWSSNPNATTGNVYGLKVLNGMSFAAAAGNANFRPIDITYTIANTGAQTGTATGIFLNATESNLNSMTHNLMDLQVGGSSKFKVDNSGVLTAFAFRGGNNGSRIIETADGRWALYNNAQNNFDRLQFGGTTSSFPALKRNGANLLVRLADDSAYTNITALFTPPAGTTTTAPITLTSGTNKATASEGSIEFSSNVLYFTPTGTDRRMVQLLGRNAQSGTSYTVAASDMGKVIAMTGTAGATVTLPLANSVPAGSIVTIKDEGGAALLNNIVVQTSGSDKIDGQPNQSIVRNYGTMTLYNNGNIDWFITASL